MNAGREPDLGSASQPEKPEMGLKSEPTRPTESGIPDTASPVPVVSSSSGDTAETAEPVGGSVPLTRAGQFHPPDASGNRLATQAPGQSDGGDTERATGFRFIIELLVGSTDADSDGVVFDRQELFAIFSADGRNAPAIERAFEAIEQGLQQLEEEDSARLDLLTRGGALVSFSLTAGFLTWLLHTGALAALAASSTTLWRHLDPIPVLLDADNREDNQH